MDVAEALHSRVDHLLRGWQAGQVVNEWLGQEPEQVLARQEKWGFSIPRSATLLHSTLSLIYTNQNLEELKRRKVASVGAGVWLWGPIPKSPGLCLLLRPVQCQNDGRSCWCVGADGSEVLGSRQPGRPVACKWEWGRLLEGPC